jgi:hypothetical protein
MTIAIEADGDKPEIEIPASSAEGVGREAQPKAQRLIFYKISSSGISKPRRVRPMSAE